MDPATIAALIDHTLLKPEADEEDIRRHCREAIRYGFYSVCVHPYRLPLAVALVHGSPVKPSTVAGFPFGTNPTPVKVAEARWAIDQGAREIDMVLNIGALKDGDDRVALEDIGAVVDVCHAGQVHCKVILETCLLTDAEKERACAIVADAGADFVKTSTGLNSGGATVADVELMSRAVKEKGLGVKAAGGIRSLADLELMVRAGATRIGTSSGVKILDEAQQ